MTTWYRLDLGNGADALPKTLQVQRDFTALFIASGPKPTGAMLFSRYNLERDNVELFFNPQAAHIAKQYGAQPCEKPTANNYRMALLCADTDALPTGLPDQGTP